MAKDLAIVLNNGGINAAVTTALASQKFRTVMLYADTEQQPASRVRAAYDQQVAHFKPYREHTLPMPFLAAAAGGPGRGAGGAAIGAASAADPRERPPIAPTLLELLPLISAAARAAAQYQATAVYLGLRIGPAADALAAATEYVQIWNELLQMPCALPGVEVVTPLLELDPWQVVDLGFQVAAPFDRTWSCAEATNEPCWACPGCRAREAAFQRAGKPDPLRAVKTNPR